MPAEGLGAVVPPQPAPDGVWAVRQRRDVDKIHLGLNAAGTSQQKYDATRKKYTDLIKAMKKAEGKLEPALKPLRDQVLFMKHNLNAKAIAGLSSELVSVQANVDGWSRTWRAPSPRPMGLLRA